MIHNSMTVAKAISEIPFRRSRAQQGLDAVIAFSTVLALLLSHRFSCFLKFRLKFNWLRFFNYLRSYLATLFSIIFRKYIFIFHHFQSFFPSVFVPSLPLTRTTWRREGSCCTRGAASRPHFFMHGMLGMHGMQPTWRNSEYIKTGVWLLGSPWESSTLQNLHTVSARKRHVSSL